MELWQAIIILIEAVILAAMPFIMIKISMARRKN